MSSDEMIYSSASEEVAKVIAAAESFKDGYAVVRETMFKNIAQSGIMIFFKVMMCEGELNNTVETLAYTNGGAEFAAYKEALEACMRSFGKFGIYSQATHNAFKAATQRARAYKVAHATDMPTGVFIPNTRVDMWRAILFGTEDEALLDMMISFKKGTAKYLEYRDKYSKGVIKYYQELAEKYIANYDKETTIARDLLLKSLYKSYLLYTKKAEDDITGDEITAINRVADSAMNRHPLKGLTDEAKLNRFQIIYQEYPVPSLDFSPSTSLQINKAKKEDIIKAQEDCARVKELMITETIGSFYSQMKDTLLKLNKNVSKGDKIDKAGEDYLNSLLETFKELRLTLGSNNQLDEMETTLSGCVTTQHVNGKSFFDDTPATVKKLFDAAGLKEAVAKYSTEVSSIVESASANKFADTMKHLKF